MGHRNALISAYNHEGCEWLAQELASRDWNLYGTSGTVKYLQDFKIPIQNISTLVGKSILGRRVMSLSREVFAGLVATPENAPEMYDMGLRYFDLAYIDLYPLESAI